MKRASFILVILCGIAAVSFAQTANNGTIIQEGIASWYGEEFAGRPTACGEIFNPSLFTAAHPNLPFGTVLTVTNKQNMRQVTVRINDRGPFVAARIIDLSHAAAEALDMVYTGTAPVTLERAINTTLGPVSSPLMAYSQPSTGTVTAAPVPSMPAPVTIVSTIEVPAAPQASFEIVYPDTQYPYVEINKIEDNAISAQPVNTLAAETPITAVTPVAYQSFYPAPAANILGGIPPAGSTKLYRLQVGAYKVPRNALDAFNKLKSLGLNPAYEQNGEFYRVVLAGLKAGEIQSIAQTLGNSGFREALIREDVQ